MGEYFHYVNHTKRLEFPSGAFGSNGKFDYIGGGLTGRAFCLLLTRSHDRDRYREFGLGAWIGDWVECIGDHGKLSDEYDAYTCISGNILVLLHRIEGPDQLLEWAQSHDAFFLQLAHFVISGQYTALEPDLQKAFGRDWKDRAVDLMERDRKQGGWWMRHCFDLVKIN